MLLNPNKNLLMSGSGASKARVGINIVLRNEDVFLSKNASSFLGSKFFTTTRVVELTARKLLEARGIFSETGQMYFSETVPLTCSKKKRLSPS